MSDELTRRLEWATGHNGAKILGQIRAEGLDVVIVRPEHLECRHLVNPKHEHGQCSTCEAPRFYQDMGFFFHCDDGTGAEAFCERPKPSKRWWQR